MKKLQLQVLILASTLGLNAQTKTDSIKKIRLSGVGLESQFIFQQGYINTANQEDFKKFVTNNKLLDKDLNGYTSASGFGRSTDANGLICVRAFFELGQGKKLRREGFIGIRFGSNSVSSASYSKTTRDTIAVYVNTANNDKLYSVAQYNDNYFYSISSKQIMVPVGINLTTNKNKRFWFGAGVELSPGISYSNMFSANHNLSKTELLLNSSSTYDKYDSYSSTSYKNVQMDQTLNKISGIGFVGYAAIPLSTNLRLSKNINARRHFSASATLAPGIFYSNNKFTSAQSNFILNASLGLRYNW
jgi:hypothetical protein